MSTPVAERPKCGCKVGRLIESYDLVGMNDKLAEWWSAEEGGRSLREMAEVLNHEVLRETMNRHGYGPLDGEVENTYELLTDAEVSEGMRTQATKRLEREGVDVPDLQDDFVSHQAVYRHLKICLDEEYSRVELNDEERRERSKEHIFALGNKTEKVVEDTLRRLRNREALSIEEFDVVVTISITCADCGRQHLLEDILERGGCDCLVSPML